jgi:cellulose biosynthesis protein BcsQ
MKCISILNFKGGVGKTSISTNAAHKLAMMGYKVLLIDCDLQHNASNLIPLKERKTTTLTHFIGYPLKAGHRYTTMVSGL